MRVNMGEIRTLVKERGQSESMQRKGGLHDERRQVPRKRGRESKKSLPRRRRKYEQVN